MTDMTKKPKKKNAVTSTPVTADPAPALATRFLQHPPALEDRSLARLQESYSMLINGQLVAAADGATFNQPGH
jgi:hypothetical protein